MGKTEEIIRLMEMVFSSDSDYVDGNLPLVVENLLKEDNDYITVEAIED